MTLSKWVRPIEKRWHSPGSVHSKASSHTDSCVNNRKRSAVEPGWKEKHSQSGFTSFSGPSEANGSFRGQIRVRLVTWKQLDRVLLAAVWSVLKSPMSQFHKHGNIFRIRNVLEARELLTDRRKLLSVKLTHSVRLLSLPRLLLKPPKLITTVRQQQWQYIYSYIFIHIDKSYVKTLCKAV